MTNIIDVTDESFEEAVTKADVPVLIDFWSEDCAPCKVLARVLEALAAKDQRVKIVKVDVDANPRLTSAYRVRSVPTVVAVKDGKTVATKVGTCSENVLLAMLGFSPLPAKD